MQGITKKQRTYYGVDVGILMVNSKFERFPGDIGNARTWNFPVQYKIVTEAQTKRMTDLHNASLLEPFKEAAMEVVAAGVAGITTTCGFLSLYQQELADFCNVPVATSSLLQVPLVQRLLPSNKRVGILTFNGEVLKGPYLEAVGVAVDTPVVGMPPDSEFVRSIRENDNSVPYETLKTEVLATAHNLMSSYPDIGAIVLECTNLAPYAADIADVCEVPVFDTVSLVNWFQAGLRPKRYQLA
ncbi:hypothetical protein R69658_06903 [Paraburkholderia aspalathi]|uniref:Aspartate/glutamate racemase family protein n=1 Tax=Paraburkholderia aspalathi TaxID=1324617 RepID=A0ABM8SZQ1_9BURK|nr:aspartate/glutamate racemase family protein [Paraburkholderia aspalathi]CAE6845091.1 hypothetical protein R69658_06903 [Paraburkholderia aspalathi]